MDDGTPGPHLVVTSDPGTSAAVALILHGGRAESHQSVPSWSAAFVRMRPFGTAIRRGRPDVAVAVLRYRCRGWNGSAADPVADVRFALDRLGETHPGAPVVLVGHSMGGRAALRSAGSPSVRGIVALAPWLPPGEPVDQVAGRDLVIMHGTRDRTTSSSASREFARAAQVRARSVLYVEMTGGDHAMLRRAATWHRLTVDFVGAMVDGDDPRRVLSLASDPRDGVADDPMTGPMSGPWARI